MISIKSAASVTRKLFSGLAAVVLILGLATSAQAQQSGGSIRGTVVGADSSTVVEVTDDSRGTTKSKSTSDGAFRFDGLPTGSYEVRVLQSGNMVDSATVTVTLGSATTVAMATTVEAIEEIVTTGTRVEALDTSIAESGLVITADALLEMPVQRDLTSVALLAPGTSRGDYRFGGNGNVAFAGASIAENTSFINGLNTTNFRTGVGFSQVPFEFYETLQIKTGGYSAKYGRSLGGVMNAKSKSGSNDWNFGANVYYESEINESPETFLAANKLDKDDETTFDVFASGPIIKDRLFFYALYSDNGQDQRYAGIQSGRDFDYEVDEGFYGFKLDAYITDDHHLEYTNFSDERTGVEAVYAFDGATQTRGAYVGDTLYERGGDNWIATYTGDFGDNFSLSVSYGENEQARTTAPASASIPVVYQYTDAGGFAAQGEWSNFTVSQGTDTREMTRVDLNWVVGNHDLSFGFDSEDNFSDESTINSGGAYWLLDPLNEYNGCDVVTECPQGANARRRTYSVGGSFETVSDAFYIQDVWEVNDNWTLELGLRNENFENLNADGDIFVEVDNQWAPRLSAVFDPKGDGTSKFFANYGLYYLPIAANTNIRMAGNETYIQDYFDWDGVSVDAQFVPTGLGAQFDQDLFGDGTVPDTRSVTDENLDAMYQTEFIVGYQRFLDSGVELGVKAIYRNLETTIEDIAIDAAVNTYYAANGWSTIPGDELACDDGAGTPARDCNSTDYFTGFHQYVLTNPGNDMTIYIPEQDETINLTAAQLGYPEAERQYAALEFTTARPFDGRWGAQMSYTWSHSWGNHEGYVKSDNGQDDAGITQNFDQPGLTDNSDGNLPNDRRHTIKAFGTYQLDNGLRFGANILWQSGRPVSCFGVHPTDVFAQAYGADAHFCGGESVQRGSLGTTPDIMTIDGTAQYNMEMGNASVLWTLDVFNIFDSANPTLYNEFFETDGGVADSDYGLIQQYQQPRTIRLSARLRF
ncbi:MAG: TonB-dependent receptor [Gammaproteobacteria bacterium]|nr:TonB-dependent receptor [Gammaproteobacteria bacterium]MDH3414936.1 TonB-dependent receptor [Gammaproteobacteria bacterium]